jgi:hypothetical protein
VAIRPFFRRSANHELRNIDHRWPDGSYLPTDTDAGRNPSISVLVSIFSINALLGRQENFLGARLNGIESQLVENMPHGRSHMRTVPKDPAPVQVALATLVPLIVGVFATRATMLAGERFGMNIVPFNLSGQGRRVEFYAEILRPSSSDGLRMTAHRQRQRQERRRDGGREGRGYKVGDGNGAGETPALRRLGEARHVLHRRIIEA